MGYIPGKRKCLMSCLLSMLRQGVCTIINVEKRDNHDFCRC